MVEIWKNIPGYEGLYDASNWGRIRSLDHWRDSGAGGYIQKGRILKQFKNKRGYLYVGLSKGNEIKRLRVHRLVYEAFKGEIPERLQVNHINEDKTDNRLENLNLMTSKENTNWGTRNQRISEKRSDPVLQLTLDEVLVNEWSSAQEAGRHGFTFSSIRACCNGRLKSHKGFLWREKNG